MPALLASDFCKALGAPWIGWWCEGRSTLGLVPQSTMREFYLPLAMFNVGKDSKSGCLGVEKTLHMSVIGNGEHVFERTLNKYVWGMFGVLMSTMNPCSLPTEHAAGTALQWIPLWWVPALCRSLWSTLPPSGFQQNYQTRNCRLVWRVWESGHYDWCMRYSSQLGNLAIFHSILFWTFRFKYDCMFIKIKSYVFAIQQLTRPSTNPATCSPGASARRSWTLGCATGSQILQMDSLQLHPVQ